MKQRERSVSKSSRVPGIGEVREGVGRCVRSTSPTHYVTFPVSGTQVVLDRESGQRVTGVLESVQWIDGTQDRWAKLSHHNFR